MNPIGDGVAINFIDAIGALIALVQELLARIKLLKA